MARSIRRVKSPPAMRFKCLAEGKFGAGTSAPPLARASVVARQGGQPG
jgi:hypothetical protein